MSFQVSEDQLKELAVKCCQLNESMEIAPDHFAIMLMMVAMYLSDAHGFARAVKMLREEASGMATPKTWAAWLEEQEKGLGDLISSKT